MFGTCLPIKKVSFRLPSFQVDKDRVWQQFLNCQMPIFCVTGPCLSGKTSLAHCLSECSNYRLINARGTIRTGFLSDVKATVEFLCKEIKNTFKFCSGYIIDDFPAQISQFRKFEKKLRRPVVIIYITLSLDASLARALVQNPVTDLNAVRIEYVKSLKFSERLYHTHEKSKKSIKIFSQHPMHDTHVKTLEILENDFSYKFKHNKSSV